MNNSASLQNWQINNEAEFIYLIREREFIRLNENTYKIGRTKQEPNKRLSGYPKNSEVIVFIRVFDCDIMETTLIKVFKKKFIHRKDYGREYFEGDKDVMRAEIYTKCQEELINNSNAVKEPELINHSNAVKGPELINNSDRQHRHEPNKLDYESPKQTQNNNNIVNLSIHINQSDQKKHYQCPLCNQNFSRLQRLESHLKRKVPCQKPDNSERLTKKISIGSKDIKLGPDIILCQYCSKKFSSKDNLTKHLKEGYCHVYSRMEYDQKEVSGKGDPLRGKKNEIGGQGGSFAGIPQRPPNNFNIDDIVEKMRMMEQQIAELKRKP